MNIPDAVTQTRIVRAKLDIYVFIATLYIHYMWVCLCVCVLQNSSDGVRFSISSQVTKLFEDARAILLI